MTGSVSILGLGASGLAAARLALLKGEVVYVSELAPQIGPAVGIRVRELEELGARVELGSHDLSLIEASDLVVVSPGIPPDAPVLCELRTRGVRWVSEPEFAVRFFSGPLIAVTGTNGKTTTSVLIAHLMECAGIDVALGGNVGGGIAPAASELALRDMPPSWYVLEMSSFQLADTETFAPQIGVLTNLAPDHLDRYSDVGSYFADKAKLFANARPSDLWVLNGEDSEALRLPGSAAGKRYLFCYDTPSDAASRTSAGNETSAGVPSAFLRDGVLTLRVGAEEALIPREELPLLGRHNVMNALAASLTARLAGAGVDGIREGLRSFRALPHRLQKVGNRGGIVWVNDSKATNVAATESALRSLDGTIVLLLGGKDKGEDFRPLGRALHGTVRAAVLYGEAAARLESEVGEGLREGARGDLSDAPAGLEPPSVAPPTLVRVHGGFTAAVAAAEELARPGDLLLLSPACSSFDEFDGYESRGQRFTELANQGATL